MMNLSQSELDQARLELLRRKVTTFGTVVGLLLISLAAVQWWVSVKILAQQMTRSGNFGMIGGAVVGLAIIIMPRVRRRRYQETTLRALVWRTIWIVTMSVLSQIGGATIMAAGISEALRPVGFSGNLGPIFVLAIFMVVLHSAAALVVPWTALEACVPPAAWAAMTVVAALGGYDSPNFILLGVALTLLSGVPGVAIAFFRSGGLRATLGLRLIGARYAEVERELAFARRLHERLFPKPVLDGPIRVEYVYEPMRQIGGDFLDIVGATDGSLLILIIDVTGHGVAAALAVNRLHGELKRTLAENAECTPSLIISSLNKYVNLTLADESVFATAVAARVWPDGRARLCIAGHPPPLLRSAEGSVTQIEPTAAILGPFAPDEFAADETEIRLSQGATLMLYTDGAIECRSAAGIDLGQQGLERIFAAAQAQTNLPGAMLKRVSSYQAGQPEDDVLIVTVSFDGRSR